MNVDLDTIDCKDIESDSHLKSETGGCTKRVVIGIRSEAAVAKVFNA